MNKDKLVKFIEDSFTNSALPTFCNYIKIQNLTPSVDPDWNTNNYQMDAAKLISQWIIDQKLAGLELTLVKDPDKTPMIFVEIPAYKTKSDKTFLLYGHFDK